MTATKELEFKNAGTTINPKTGEGDPLWDNDLLWVKGWRNLIDNPSPEGKIYYASSIENYPIEQTYMVRANAYDYEKHESLGVEGITLYDAGSASYRCRLFRKEDIDKMELCGVIFTEKLKEDGGFYKLVANGCRQFKDRLMIEQINNLPKVDKIQSLELAFTFYKKFYGTPRYRNEQDLLWLDMKKDHAERLGKFFEGCPEVYVQLFLRRVAHQLGMHFGNYSGD